MTDTHPADAAPPTRAARARRRGLDGRDGGVAAVRDRDRRSPVPETLTPNDDGRDRARGGRPASVPRPGRRDRRRRAVAGRSRDAGRADRRSSSTELGLAESGLDRWSVDPLDGPQVDVPQRRLLPAARDRGRRRGAARALAGDGPVDRPPRRGAAAVDGDRVPWRRARWSTASSTSSTTSSRSRTRRGRWPRPPAPTTPAGRGRRARPVRRRHRRGDPRRHPAGVRAAPGVPRRRARVPSRGRTTGPGCRTSPAATAAYRHLVRAHTTLDLDPEAIHATGLDEIARIDAEFEELGGRDARDRAIGGDPRPPPRRPGAPLRDAATRSWRRPRRPLAARDRRRSRRWFGRLPRRRLRGRRHGRPRGEALDDRLLPPARRATAAGPAATTSTRRCPRRGRATRPRRSPSTRPSPAITSRSRSPRS